MKDKEWKVGDTATYPYDFGCSTLCELPEVVAFAWVKEKFPKEFENGRWLNKLFIIVETHLSGAIALYNHDCKYYLIKMK